MLKNYFTVAIRNLLRNKVFSTINILGLAVGISSALVIYLIVHYSYSFDRFEPGGDRVYRVVENTLFMGNAGHSRGVPAPLGEAIRNELTGMEENTTFRVWQVQKTVVPAVARDRAAGGDHEAGGGRSGSTFKFQQGVIFADGHYLGLLPYRWLAGSPGIALEKPGQVVLDESRARLYFPHLTYPEMIGRKIVYEDSIETTVSGVVADLKEQGNTDFSFQEFVSLQTLLDNKWMRDQFHWDDWGAGTSDHEIYVRLTRGVKPATIEAGLAKLSQKYLGGYKDYKVNFRLQPLQDIHFNRDYGVLSGATADKSVLLGLTLIAAFLLLLGCINFVNLTTAHALQRAKEIGIRKTMGSSRGQLIRQFLGETFVITLLATVVSILVTPLLLQAFADYIPQDLHFSPGQPYLLLFGVLLVCVVSLLAGFYPALVLSSWKPVNVLKSRVFGGGGAGKARVRQTLTVAQFVIAQFFVIATLLVCKQISFLLSQDLGFRQQAIFSFGVPYSDTAYLQRKTFVHEIQQISGVAGASLAADVPFSGGWMNEGTLFDNGKVQQSIMVQVKPGDTNYRRIFGIPLLAGRDVQPSDTFREVVINETCLHQLGFRRPQDALGKVFQWDADRLPIVGVMKDFYAHSDFKVGPLVLTEANKDCRDVIVALPAPADGGKGSGEGGWKSTIAQIEALYKQTYPGEEFDYGFLDEGIAAYYANEKSIARLLTWAAGIMIFISCLGLLGLVIYTTQQRVKEIGVRKVLGASVTNIVSVLSMELVGLVAIAFLVASPIAWWALHRWLADYTLRTEISWWVFALCGAGMILVAVVTLSTQTIRAARSNPVKSLRTE